MGRMEIQATQCFNGAWRKFHGLATASLHEMLSSIFIAEV